MLRTIRNVLWVGLLAGGMAFSAASSVGCSSDDNGTGTGGTGGGTAGTTGTGGGTAGTGGTGGGTAGTGGGTAGTTGDASTG